MMETRGFQEALSQMARSMQDARGNGSTLDRAVTAATDLIADCDCAGVSVSSHAGVVTRAAQDQLVVELDALQTELGEGPCMDALRDQETVYSGNLSTDERWPTWGPRAARDLGVHSVLAHRLFTTKQTLGALTLFSRSPDGFDAADRADGDALAAQVAIAVAAEISAAHMQAALTSRTVIGQAQGILMERFDLTADVAFEVLARFSSHQNIRLHQVAEELVHTRTLPKVSRSWRPTAI